MQRVLAPSWTTHKQTKISHFAADFTLVKLQQCCWREQEVWKFISVQSPWLPLMMKGSVFYLTWVWFSRCLWGLGFASIAPTELLKLLVQKVQGTLHHFESNLVLENVTKTVRVGVSQGAAMVKSLKLVGTWVLIQRSEHRSGVLESSPRTLLTIFISNDPIFISMHPMYVRSAHQ